MFWSVIAHLRRPASSSSYTPTLPPENLLYHSNTWMMQNDHMDRGDAWDEVTHNTRAIGDGPSSFDQRSSEFTPEPPLPTNVMDYQEPCHKNSILTFHADVIDMGPLSLEKQW
ncbi:hypothetical protein TNCV_1664581 [Trichonephila clavipes]|uniref:Uncharacterized protein n=1 Tax=Trichonephila clavipes TaxID=2585209 RepID=A0A8X6RSV5_TRICX|nr:hypothetical protein TNCV_1664581 [Trichonephila clavipes]